MRLRRRYEVVVQGESGSAVSQRSVISEHRSERDAREAAGLERRRLEMIRAEEAASWLITVVRGDEVLHEERPFDGRREAVPVPPVSALGITQHERPADDPAPADDVPAADDAHAGAVEGETIPAAEGPVPEEPEATAGDGGDASSTGTIPAVTADRADEDADADAEDALPLTAPADIMSPADAGLPAFLTAGRPDAGDTAADDGATGRAERPRTPGDSVPSGPVPDDIIKRFEESIARERARERARGSHSDRR